MRLSKATVDVLKNFAGINTNLTVRAGNQLKTVAMSECVLATANVVEEFPAFAIYDLSEFLGVLSLFKDPELEFEAGSVRISEGKNEVSYTFGDEKTFKVRPPEKEYPFPTADIAFDLPEVTLKDLLRAASVLKVEDIVITSDGKSAPTIQVTDIKNPSANSFSVELPLNPTASYKMILKVENLRLMPGDYRVEISKKKVSRFTQTGDSGVTYFIAMHASSKFED